MVLKTIFQLYPNQLGNNTRVFGMILRRAVLEKRWPMARTESFLKPIDNQVGFFP